MHLMSRYGAGKLLALALLAAALNACTPLENEPKKPLVIPPPSELAGEFMATKVSQDREEAQISYTTYTDSGIGIEVDTLSTDEFGDPINIRDMTYEREAPGYYSEQNSSDKFIALPDSVDFVVTADVEEQSINLATRVAREPLPEEDEAEEQSDTEQPIVLPDLDVGEYTCFVQEQDTLGKEASHSSVSVYQVTFASGEAFFQMDMPGHAAYQFSTPYEFQEKGELVFTEFRTTPEAWDEPSEQLTQESATGQMIPTHVYEDIAGSCSKGELRVITPGTEDDPEVTKTPNSQLFASCHKAYKSMGGASPDGQILHFASAGYLQRNLREEQLDRSDGAQVKLENAGWHPRESWGVCVKRGRGLNNTALAGDYWLSEVGVDNGAINTRFASWEVDDLGNGIESPVAQSEDLAPRSILLELNVDTDGELSVNGQRGMMANRGDFLVYDASQPSLGVSGIGIAVRLPVPEEPEE